MAVEKIGNYNIHQNPATNENQFDVENYLNENWNKTKEVVNNNADELISVQGRVSALETDNTTNKQDISEIKEEQIEQNTNIESLQTKLEKVEKEFNDYAIHGQASGEFIHLTDSAKASCKIEVEGNVKQTVTEQSANLLDSYFENKIINGITASYNSETQEITLNGTCTKNNTIIEFLKFKAIEMNANENIYLTTKYISGSCTAGANCAWGVYNSTFTKNLTAKLNGINSDKEGSLLFTDTTVLSLARIRVDEGDV